MKKYVNMIMRNEDKIKKLYFTRNNAFDFVLSYYVSYLQKVENDSSIMISEVGKSK